MTQNSFKSSAIAGMALDPIHVGTGGERLGRVDNTIVRDPASKLPKIPGSSLAGVLRTYVAMSRQDEDPNRKVDGKPKPYYPDCAGQGQPRQDGSGGHCGQATCQVCTVFGFARGQSGGFAGLASFSDIHLLLFPVATRKGPLWITAPAALRLIRELREFSDVPDNTLHLADRDREPTNVGWLMLPTSEASQLDKWDTVTQSLSGLGVPPFIIKRTGVVSDKLFSHIVNSNLEVRTSVSINPATGAAEDGALFTYEAIPRSSVLLTDITCRNPKHFRIGGNSVTAVDSYDAVLNVIKAGFPFLEALGIGGMGSRGMGRVRALDGVPTTKEAEK